MRYYSTEIWLVSFSSNCRLEFLMIVLVAGSVTNGIWFLKSTQLCITEYV